MQLNAFVSAKEQSTRPPSPSNFYLQPSLIIFVLAVTVFLLLKNNPALMTIITSPSCYFMISTD